MRSEIILSFLQNFMNSLEIPIFFLFGSHLQMDIGRRFVTFQVFLFNLLILQSKKGNLCSAQIVKVIANLKGAKCLIGAVVAMVAKAIRKSSDSEKEADLGADETCDLLYRDLLTKCSTSSDRQAPRNK